MKHDRAKWVPEVEDSVDSDTGRLSLAIAHAVATTPISRKGRADATGEKRRYRLQVYSLYRPPWARARSGSGLEHSVYVTPVLLLGTL